jgi:hypothetical protein
MDHEKATPKNTGRGAQIAYIPSHAKGDIHHSDVQFGFVTSKTQNGAFCRYFRSDGKELRTTANSELTPWNCLVLYHHHIDSDIDNLLDGIDKEQKKSLRGGT